LTFLAPYTVVDFTDGFALLAGRMLADLGADVVQVEPPGGALARTIGPFDADGASLHWEAFAANKRSATIDLASPDGRAAAFELCRTADFVFESAPAGRMEGLGLGYAELAAANPALIYVSITPFGSSGPKAGWAHSDITLWAAGGALKAHRDGERPPLSISVPQAWLHASGDAACGALVALHARSRSGQGQRVEVAVIESVTQATLSRTLATAVGDPQGSAMVVDQAQAAAGNVDQSGSGSGSVNTKWRVSDGWIELHLAMGPATGKFTNNLFAWLRELGCDEGYAEIDWRAIPQLVAAGTITLDEIARARETVRQFLAGRTRQELLDASVERKLLAVPIDTIADIVENPHLRERGFFVEVGDDPENLLLLPGVTAPSAQHGFCSWSRAPRLEGVTV
jgi:crotonobetainyl-CoA:carnitine CoA-transferase CaiB-like acyl-CoA transferase